MRPDRCGECKACRYLAATAKIVMSCANPPFSHVRPGEVEMWNRAVEDSPCERWGLSALEAYFKSVSAVLAATRPLPPGLLGVHVWSREILADRTTDRHIRLCASRFLRCHDEAALLAELAALDEGRNPQDGRPGGASVWYACHKAKEILEGKGNDDEGTPVGSPAS